MKLFETKGNLDDRPLGLGIVEFCIHAPCPGSCVFVSTVFFDTNSRVLCKGSEASGHRNTRDRNGKKK